MSSIVLVSPFPPPMGGMAVQADKLCSCLRQEGWQVIAVRTNPQLPAFLSWLEYIPFVRTIVRSGFFLWHLNRALNEAGVVLFLTAFFDFFFWVTYPALLLIFLRKKRVLLSARGGKAGDFFRRYRIFVKPLLQKVDVIATPSGFLRDVFKSALGLSVDVIPNIADLEQFQFKLRERFQPNFIVTRNLEPIYDVAGVIRAMGIIVKDYPQAKLGIVGTGSQRPELERLVYTLGLDKNVCFYGMVDHEKIVRLYGEYDIFLNCSKVDNLPGTILEAFASGLPVVSTNAGGIPYMVEDGKTGLLVDVGDWQGLAQKAMEVMKDRNLAHRLVKNGYREVQKYRWEFVRGKLLPVLESLARDG